MENGMKQEQSKLVEETEIEEADWCYYSGMPAPGFYEKKFIEKEENFNDKIDLLNHANSRINKQNLT